MLQDIHFKKLVITYEDILFIMHQGYSAENLTVGLIHWFNAQ